jgi:hypothetical protein
VNGHVVDDSVSRRRHRIYRRTLQVAAALLDASDPMDLGVWERLLAQDAHIRVANRPVAVGHAQCVLELAALFPHIAAMGRQFREVWPSPDGETVLMELDLLPVGSVPAIPLSVIARVVEPDALLKDVRLYFDPHPLGLTAQSTRLPVSS